MHLSAGACLRDANVNEATWTPLHAVLCVRAHESSMKLFKKFRRAMMEEHFPTQAQPQVHTLARLILAGINVNQPCRDGRFPLHMAMDETRGLPCNYMWDIVKMLLNAGANVNVFDSTGRQPLHAFRFEDSAYIPYSLMQRLTTETVDLESSRVCSRYSILKEFHFMFSHSERLCEPYGGCFQGSTEWACCGERLRDLVLGAERKEKFLMFAMGTITNNRCSRGSSTRILNVLDVVELIGRMTIATTVDPNARRSDSCLECVLCKERQLLGLPPHVEIIEVHSD